MFFLKRTFVLEQAHISINYHNRSLHTSNLIGDTAMFHDPATRDNDKSQNINRRAPLGRGKLRHGETIRVKHSIHNRRIYRKSIRVRTELSATKQGHSKSRTDMTNSAVS